MNNKGFTLVELLAVMLILVSISLIVVGGISASLERRDERECEEQKELAIGAAKIYFSLSDVVDKDVTISELKNEGYFSNNKKVDELDDDDEISIGTNDYVYTPTDNSCVKE